MIRVQLNGEPRELPDGLSVAALLDQLGVRGERVAVEVNLDVVRREARSERLIVDGDRVEIVSFVGGGL
jgi:sulfur carrier protein